MLENLQNLTKKMHVVTENQKEFREFVNQNNADHQRYNSKIIEYSVREDAEKYESKNESTKDPQS